jgi:hypothetical protein
MRDLQDMLAQKLQESGGIGGFTVSSDPNNLGSQLQHGLHLGPTDRSLPSISQVQDQLAGKKVEVIGSGGVKIGETVLEKQGNDSIQVFESPGGGRTLTEKFVDRVEDAGIKIPEKVAKARGLQDAQGGGKYTVDRSIDDFDDALAALGVTSVTIKPVQKAKEKAEQAKEAVKNDTTMSKNSKIGIGVLAVPVALYTAYRVFR